MQTEEVARGSCIAVPFQKPERKKNRWGNVSLLPILFYRSLIPVRKEGFYTSGKGGFFPLSLSFTTPKAEVIK